MEGIFEEGTGIDNPCRKKLNAFWRATGVIGEALDNVLEAIVMKVDIECIVGRPIDRKALNEMPWDTCGGMIYLGNLLI